MNGPRSPGRDPAPPQGARLRLGAVSYLNARPLTFGLDEEPRFELAYDVPSVCADDLAAGRIDLGLIPAVEYGSHPGAGWIVPGIAIGSRADVMTVRLFFRGHLADVRRVAVDTSSRTSVALLQILLREMHGLDPQLVPAAPDLDAMLHSADAALLIGDPVLPLVDAGVLDLDAGDRQSLDLGREWHELTGHPFVFAFWAGGEGRIAGDDVRRLQEARCRGEEHICEIAAAFQRQRAGSADLYERYLRDHICYDFGSAQVSGLAEFYRLAHRHRLIESSPELRFY